MKAKDLAGRAFRMPALNARFLVEKVSDNQATIRLPDGKIDTTNADGIVKALKKGVIEEVTPTWDLLRWR